MPNHPVRGISFVSLRWMGHWCHHWCPISRRSTRTTTRISGTHLPSSTEWPTRTIGGTHKHFFHIMRQTISIGRVNHLSSANGNQQPHCWNPPPLYIAHQWSFTYWMSIEKDRHSVSDATGLYLPPSPYKCVNCPLGPEKSSLDPRQGQCDVYIVCMNEKIFLQNLRDATCNTTLVQHQCRMKCHSRYVTLVTLHSFFTNTWGFAESSMNQELRSYMTALLSRIIVPLSNISIVLSFSLVHFTFTIFSCLSLHLYICLSPLYLVIGKSVEKANSV